MTEIVDEHIIICTSLQTFFKEVYERKMKIDFPAL